MTTVDSPYRIGETPRKYDAVADSLTGSEAEDLAKFLDDGEPVLMSPGTFDSPFSDDPDMQVRLGVVTDGKWVWDLAWADYVAYHRVAPPAEFREHVREMRYTCPELPEERLMEIAEAIGLPME